MTKFNLEYFQRMSTEQKRAEIKRLHDANYSFYQERREMIDKMNMLGRIEADNLEKINILKKGIEHDRVTAMPQTREKVAVAQEGESRTVSSVSQM